MKKVLSNFYIRTIVGVIITILITKMFGMITSTSALTEKERVQRIADSANGKNVRDQMWDLFQDRIDHEKDLKRQIDSIRNCCSNK
jgi:hypothetical protein